MVLTGKISLKTRYSNGNGALSPIEYHVTKTVLEDSICVDGDSILIGIKGERGERGERGEQGIQGERGLSAYDIVKQHGYTGTETDFTNMLIDFEAAAAKVVDAEMLAEVSAANAGRAALEVARILEEIKEVTNNG